MLVFMMVTCGLTLIMLMIQFRTYGYYPENTVRDDSSSVGTHDITLKRLCVEEI